MKSAVATIRLAMDAEAPISDGRKARTFASRVKIIQAMVELVAAGDPSPSAVAVAEKAGVGLRTVFRHFEDMDTLLREIDSILVKVYRPILDAPYEGSTWKERLFELIDRRCLVNEAIVVFRISSLMVRYRSDFVQENFLELYDREKDRLNSVLPDSLKTSTSFGQMILVATSFDTWRMYRQDEQKSAEKTVTAIKNLVNDIIAATVQ